MMARVCDGACFACGAGTPDSVNTRTPLGIMCLLCQSVVRERGGDPFEGDTPSLMGAHALRDRAVETMEAAAMEYAWALAARERWSS